ncbi:MAG: alpha-2-macroglobulin, partial [Polaribacter sp.]|nr:alpha-2-macroglobulin [Polaribacter sp.]
MMKRMSGISEKGKTDEIEMADGLEVEELEEIAFMKIEDNTKEKISLKKIQIRKNFKETAFFFPQLKTDKNGKVSFSFVMPEALTRWKLQLLAHTTDLKSSSKTLQTITQKELMVVPNVPRFLREKDTITLSAKITNLTNNQLSGIAKLLLTDAISGKEIDMEFQNTNTTKSFIVDKDGNTNVSWQISIPETVQAVQYKIVANSDAFSDGEQNVLPILTNKMLVTETLPIWVRSNQTKTFTFDKLKKNTSSTLKNHKLTLEMSSNPVWYAVQSLPYLMEYPHACSEQMFSKYYAN